MKHSISLWKLCNPFKSPLTSKIAVKTILGSDRTGNKVYLNETDDARHSLVLGATGTGKTKYLENILRQNLLNGSAFCLIDPHGDISEALMAFLAQNHPYLAEKIVYFNPGAEKNMIGFDPILRSPNIHVNTIKMIEAILKVWGGESIEYPRMRRFLFNVIFPLASNNLSLLEAEIFLNPDSKIDRKNILSRVEEEAVLADWMSFEKLPVKNKIEVIESSGNRLRLFLQNPRIRQIFSLENPIDFEGIMREGKVLICNFSGQGRLAHDDVRLLSVLMVNQIFNCALQRDFKDGTLRQMTVVIDEFGSVVCDDAARVVEQLRKYRVNLIAVCQELEQLRAKDPCLYHSILSNTTLKTVFGGIGYEDAEIMAKELYVGFLDLKSVKHETERTIFAPVEGWIEVVSRTTGKTDGTSFSENDGYGTSSSSTAGESRNRGETNNLSRNYEGYNFRQSGYSSGMAGSVGFSQSSNTTTGETHKFGTARGVNNSVSESESRTLQPHTTHEERREVTSTQFWNKDELLYMSIGELKNQPVGQATIKIGTNPPVQIIIDRVEEVFYHPEESPKMIEAFKTQVFQAHSDIYVPVSSLKALPPKAQVIEAEFMEAKKTKESPFNG